MQNCSNCEYWIEKYQQCDNPEQRSCESEAYDSPPDKHCELWEKNSKECESMSDDLISRQATLDSVERIFKQYSVSFGENSFFGTAIRSAIERLPVEYDVDKVVEQLEEERNSVPVNRILDDITNDNLKELGKIMAYSKSIEIVKAGGKE